MILPDGNSEKRILDLGCGRRKVPGAIGVDRMRVPGVDVVHDLDQYPYPFQADTFDEIHARHVIEHVESVVRFLDELHRLGKAGATVFISTPHYSYTGSWRDPTHRWHFSTYSFEYFEAGHPADYYTSAAKFRIVSVRVTMLRFWRLLGVEFLINGVNRHPSLRIFRRTWEEYLSFLMRGREIQAQLEVVKHA